MKLLNDIYEPLVTQNGLRFNGAVSLKSLTEVKGVVKRKLTVIADREITLRFGDIITRSNGEQLRVISNPEDFKTPELAGLKLGMAVCIS